jgi:hypothetical protein
MERIAMTRQGIYRDKAPNGPADHAVVKDVNSGEADGRLEHIYTELDYRAAGYQPPFDELRTKARYDTWLAQTKRAAMETARAAASKKNA